MKTHSSGPLSTRSALNPRRDRLPPQHRKGIQGEVTVNPSQTEHERECPVLGLGAEWPHGGQREPRGREHGLWPPPPSRATSWELFAGENWVGCIKDHFLYARLVQRGEVGGCVVGFAGGENVNLSVSYLSRSVIRGQIASPHKSIFLVLMEEGTCLIEL